MYGILCAVCRTCFGGAAPFFDRKGGSKMENVKNFLKRKDIVITPQRYLIDALGAMAPVSYTHLTLPTILRV